jgi:hypothetical protein
VAEDSELEDEEDAKAGSPVWPTSLSGLTLGTRVDGLDHKGSWYVGTVIQLDKASGSLRVLVHFDRFSSRWDEWYGEEHWAANKLLPAYTRTQVRKKVYETQVGVHFTPAHTHAPGRKSWNPCSTMPLSCQVVHRWWLRGGTTGGDHGATEVAEALTHRRRISSGSGGGAKELFGVPFFVACEGNRSFRHLFLRVLKQAMRFLSPAYRQAVYKQIREGRLSNGADSDLPFVMRIVNSQQPTSACGVCRAAGCQGCNLPIEGYNVVGNVISTHTSLALDWVDPSAYYDLMVRPVADPSFKELETRMGARAGVTLEACLDEYTKEDTLEEETWRCSRCKALRRASTKTKLWKLPDILVIHIKRFQSAGRWRDKVRTRVSFPLEGLRMSRWLYKGEGDGPSSGGEAGDDEVYDLYGVINHVGCMSGGHYTAACRSRSLNRDGSHEGLQPCAPGVWKVAPTWLHFDDEYVEMAHPDDVVAGNSAYVLFYSRRKFRPSNVLNMDGNCAPRPSQQQPPTAVRVGLSSRQAGVAV